MNLIALIWLEAFHRKTIGCFGSEEGPRARFATWETTRLLDPWVHKWMKP